MMSNIYYRFHDTSEPEGIRVFETKFYIQRQTECYVWVKPEWGGKLRKIRKDAMRTYCYPTREAAWNSYLCRKRSQLRHARHAVAVSEYMVTNAPTNPPPHGSVVGRPETFDSYSWGEY